MEWTARRERLAPSPDDPRRQAALRLPDLEFLEEQVAAILAARPSPPMNAA